jgi:hypothetical protein
MMLSSTANETFPHHHFRPPFLGGDGPHVLKEVRGNAGRQLAVGQSRSDANRDSHANAWSVSQSSVTNLVVTAVTSPLFTSRSKRNRANATAGMPDNKRRENET